MACTEYTIWLLLHLLMNMTAKQLRNQHELPVSYQLQEDKD
jgi:hypothetical protein